MTYYYDMHKIHCTVENYWENIATLPCVRSCKVHINNLFIFWLKSTVAALATNKNSEGFVDFDILLFLENVNNSVHITLLFLLAINWIETTYIQLTYVLVNIDENESICVFPKYGFLRLIYVKIIKFKTMWHHFDYFFLK